MGSIVFTWTSEGVVGNSRELELGLRNSGGLKPGIPVVKGEVVRGVAWATWATCTAEAQELPCLSSSVCRGVHSMAFSVVRLRLALSGNNPILRTSCSGTSWPTWSKLEGLRLSAGDGLGAALTIGIGSKTAAIVTIDREKLRINSLLWFWNFGSALDSNLRY